MTQQLMLCVLGSMSLCAQSPAAAPSSAPITVARLRCEYMENPLGVEAAQPRLSWIIESPRRGETQAAYQVLGAGTMDDLDVDRGNVWDSGKVKSNTSVHVPYGGRRLSSGTRVFWKVRVWDREDKPSGWSQPAFFEMGLLQPEDWRGRWIGATASESQPQAEKELDGVPWIYTDEGSPGVAAPDGKRYFRLEFPTPAQGKVKSARCMITADDEYVLHIDGQEVGKGEWPVVGEYQLKDRLKPTNAILVEVNNRGGCAGLICKITLKLESGEDVLLMSDKQWKWSTTPTADGAALKSAAQVGVFPGVPWGRLNQPRKALPAPYFRKAFKLDREVKSARAYVSGLGYHEMYLNGRKVGDHVLDPAFTRYDKRALYVVHDVTSMLQKGENAVGVILGTGWYDHHAHDIWNFDKAPWRDAPCVIAQIRVDYEDGTQALVTTDESWQVGTGPILSDGIFMGETYDARLERPEWATAAFEAKDWSNAVGVRGPKGRLVAQVMPPIKVVETRKPAAVKETKPGVFVFDMGQAFAGWTQLRVRGPAGTQVVMKYGERLNEDGTVRQNEITPYIFDQGFQTDRYILKGGGNEVWEPRFNYHAFRYVEVTGLPASPTIDTLAGRVVHTAYPSTGTFTCSNPLLEKIQQCTLWSYGANFYGYPTDCPHREKNGWTGDAHLAAEQAMYNFDNVAAYEKWMNDLFDEQRDGGELPGIVPSSGWGYHWGNGPAWDSAYVLIPWYLYEYYGDLRVLERHYDRMKRYVDYMTSRARDHIVDFGLGDWVPFKTETPVAVTSTGYYYADAMVVARAAQLLGKSEDAAKYTELAEQIRAAFNKTFYDANSGLYAGGTQTAMSCALHMGLADGDDMPKLVTQLADDVTSKGGHLDCGILGTKYLLRALSDNGRADVAYAVASQRTIPSWGWWTQQGATTLWEDWKGEASRMHIMFGDVSAWFYRSLAGIQPDLMRPGFQHIIIAPNPVEGLTWARGEYDSVRGRIVSSWKMEEGRLQLDITVPANATATLLLPGGDAAKAREGDGPANKAEGVTFVRSEGGRIVYELGSGTYAFSVDRK